MATLCLDVELAPDGGVHLPRPEAVYTEELRARLARYYEAKEYPANYWAFDFEKSWRKLCSGVERQLALARRIERWLPLRGRRVLVIGSHFGEEAIAYALRGAVVTGLELDREAMELSRQLIAAHGVSIDLRHMDATQTTFRDGQFDYVSCAQVLEHVPPDRQFPLLAEMWRVCRAGGLIWIDTPNQHFWKDQHDTGLPFIHWLPRRAKLWLARRLGRSSPTREPAFGFAEVGLHYYVSYLGLCRMLCRLGRYEVLTRFKGYADLAHFTAERAAEGRAGGPLFALKVAALRPLLAMFDWNLLSAIRVLVRKVA